ncbi:MAG: 2-amino-4-hydroxy-6-hydroxymethyldihydropteridine diphosphokinase, partial [Elusimicrobiota bacterium]|nr:2-amino-4-hydroxy-6-hydroxymethyldihydropteridine diphosphokinase [Elusimicrobiota bacterium]
INIDNFLNLPHPKLHERKFVLYPLAEIYPNWTHPVLNKTVIEILENLNDNYICEKLNINF